ncbi:MAG: hypothetical protein QXJ51_05995 [Sulfolobales archaeon]|jgi:uncharacterized protein (TIGR00290 family)
MRIALVSGGKDSYYAVYKYGSIDIALILFYEFPRPSPHLINLGKSVESMLLAGIPVVVARARRGREPADTIEILRLLNATTIIAGDVYIEDHLKYMENISREVGARLVEPLWGLEPAELLRKEIEDGIEPLIIGSDERVVEWIGRVLDRDNIDLFIESARTRDFDPLGERGEYHTIVVNGPMHRSRLEYKIAGVERFNGYSVLRLI